jgi:hypothetical protein
MSARGARQRSSIVLVLVIVFRLLLLLLLLLLLVVALALAFSLGGRPERKFSLLSQPDFDRQPKIEGDDDDEDEHD